jgi:hypothetical protein
MDFLWRTKTPIYSSTIIQFESRSMMGVIGNLPPIYGGPYRSHHPPGTGENLGDGSLFEYIRSIYYC